MATLFQLVFESGAKMQNWIFIQENLQTPEMTLTNQVVNDISYQGA